MKNVHRAKSAHRVPHVLRVKIASHVANVKNVCANCASHWTLRQPLPVLLLQLLPRLKNARLANRVKNVRHVKNVNHVLRVKNVNLVPSKPLPPAKKKC